MTDQTRLYFSFAIIATLAGCLFDTQPPHSRVQALGECGAVNGAVWTQAEFPDPAVDIGTFEIDYVDDQLVVRLNANGGRVVTAYHLYVGSGPVPVKVPPQQYPYVDSTLKPWSRAYSIVVPLAELGVPPGACPTLHFALYVTFSTLDSFGYHIVSSTRGWAEGRSFNYPCPGQLFCQGLQRTTSCCAPPQPDAGPEPDAMDPGPPTPGDTSIEDQLSDLYTGADPPQKDVEPGAIDVERIAALRGLVTARDGAALAGATVRIHGRTDYGYTLTDAAGEYSMVVSGGERVLVDVELEDHLPAQRAVTAGWHDITWADDIALVNDSASPRTTITTGAPSFQQVLSNAESDSDGTRRAVILVPPGTTATLEASDGTQTALSNPTISITEYTVGPDGPSAMPGVLPGATAYTYAAAFRVEQAAPGEIVQFNQPVLVYVDNFLGFPVGEQLPSGFYDVELGAWVAEPNGRIIQITAISAGLADLDIDGDGAADDEAALAALGVTSAERSEIASLYSTGTMLWRLPVSHFSSYDFNAANQPPGDARHPRNGSFSSGMGDGPCEEPGSIIECRNQVLRETVPITGTSLGLHYTSASAEGRSANRALIVPLSDSDPPESCLAIHLDVQVAGRRFKQQFPCTPNQTHTFVWDGIDAWGRRVQGSRLARVRIGYQYNGVSYARSELFGTSARILGQWPLFGGSIESLRAGQAFILWTEARRRIGALTHGPTNSIGGWTLTSHHRRDRAGRRLYFGDGTRQTIRGGKLSVDRLVDPPVINHRYEGALAPAPDGSLYYSSGRQIFRRNRDGTIELFAGNNALGQSCTGDVSDPLQASFGIGHAFGTAIGILDMALGPDQSLYVWSAGRLTRIHPDGHVTLLGSEPDICGSIPPGVVEIAPGRRGIIVDADSSVQLWYPTGVERIGADGEIRQLDWRCYPGGGLFYDVVADGAGGLLGACSGHIKRRRPDGSVEIVAGGGTGGEGDPATSARVAPLEIVVGPDGTVFFTHLDQGFVTKRLMRIQDGVLERVAGDIVVGFPGPAFDVTEPYEVYFRYVSDLAVTPAGDLLTLEAEDSAIRRIGAGATTGQLLVRGTETFESVVDQSGGVLYLFDEENRHRETIDAASGKSLALFDYDPEGRLASASDADGNTITLSRDANGIVADIVAPFGQSTGLEYDAQGYLSRVVDPLGDDTSFVTSATGLLRSMTDAEGREHSYFYDSRGRLVLDDLPIGQKNLNRTDTRIGEFYFSSVDVTTGLGRTRSYDAAPAPCPSGFVAPCDRISVVEPDGTTTSSISSLNGSQLFELADGTTVRGEIDPDPRWGMVAPRPSRIEAVLSNGQTRTTTYEYQTTLSDPNDPLSVTELREIANIDGNEWIGVYDLVNREITNLSPMARRHVATLDENDRVVRSETPGVLPTTYDYDSLGRLVRIAQGDRETTFAFDEGSGFLDQIESLRDVIGGVRDVLSTFILRDSVGQPIEVTRSDGTLTENAFDSVGNLRSMSAAGSVHRFEVNDLDQQNRYLPPDLGDGANRTVQSEFNVDGQPAWTVHGDGSRFDFSYTSGGKLDQVMASDGSVVNFSYEPDGFRRVKNVNSFGGPAPATGLVYTYDGPDPTGVVYLENGTPVGGALYDMERWVSEGIIVESVSPFPDLEFAHDADRMLIRAGPIQFDRDSENGRATRMTLAQTVTDFHFDAYGGSSGVTVTSAGVERFDEFLQLDRLGRVTDETITIDGQAQLRAYSYDDASRLIEVRDGVGAILESYAYDDRDNRIADSENPIGSIVVDAQDQLTVRGGDTLSYDLRGNLTSITGADGQTTFGYDIHSRLIRVEKPDGTTIENVVAPDGSLIGRIVNGVRIDTFGPGSQGRPHRQTVAGTSTRFVFAEGAWAPTMMERSGVQYALVKDRRMSVRLVIRLTDNVVVQRLDYDSYGAVTVDTNPGFQPFGYAGGLYDPDTGLLRLGARTYHPVLGRFLQRDPAGFPDGPNRYAYVAGDPVNFADFTGYLRNSVSATCLAKPLLCAIVFGVTESSMRNAAKSYVPNEYHCLVDAGFAGAELAATGGALLVVRGPSAVAGSAAAAAGAPKQLLPGLRVSSKQFGKKAGKHAKEFGLDPSIAGHRQWVRNRIDDIVARYDEVRQGPWNPRGGGGSDYVFYRQGTDVVVTKPSGDFVTVLPGGQANGWFNGATSLLP